MWEPPCAAAPGERGHKRFLHRLSGEAGSAHDVEAEIYGDAFRLDDHRLPHVELARSMSVLIVNGDPVHSQSMGVLERPGPLDTRRRDLECVRAVRWEGS